MEGIKNEGEIKGGEGKKENEKKMKRYEREDRPSNTPDGRYVKRLKLMSMREIKNEEELDGRGREEDERKMKRCEREDRPSNTPDGRDVKELKSRRMK